MEASSSRKEVGRAGGTLWKRRAGWFLAGAAVAIGCTFIRSHWLEFVPYPSFDRQPVWLRQAHLFVGWLPWLAIAIALVLRLCRVGKIPLISFTLGIVSPTLLLVSSLIYRVAEIQAMRDQPFDPKIWKHPDRVVSDRAVPPRAAMIDDLIRSKRLDGLSSGDVVDLLGPPYDKRFPPEARKSDLHYYVGPGRGAMGEGEWLFISLGPNGRVSRYWISGNSRRR